MNTRVSDLIGQRFGKLVVVEFDHLDEKHKAVWRCRCDCGNECFVSSHNMKRIKHLSCGCTDGRKEPRKPNSIQSAFTSAYYGIKGNAIKRNYVFEISKEQFATLSQRDCFYCGCPPANTIHRRGQAFTYNGLDRMDNSKGYVIENVVPCCPTCNVRKGTQNKAGFLNWIKAVYERQY